MKSFNNDKKTNIIALSVIVVLIIGCIILNAIMNNGKKLVCTSNKGDITLFYNKKKIKKYKVRNMKYDIKEQNEYFKEVGKTKYLKEFSDWFEKNSDGKCEYK